MTLYDGTEPCAGATAIFNPSRTGSRAAYHHAITQAKQTCATCPKQVPCLEGAQARQEPGGVWGGVNFDEINAPALNRKQRTIREATARRTLKQPDEYSTNPATVRQRAFRARRNAATDAVRAARNLAGGAA